MSDTLSYAIDVCCRCMFLILPKEVMSSINVTKDLHEFHFPFKLFLNNRFLSNSRLYDLFIADGIVETSDMISIILDEFVFLLNKK